MRVRVLAGEHGWLNVFSSLSAECSARRRKRRQFSVNSGRAHFFATSTQTSMSSHRKYTFPPERTGPAQHGYVSPGTCHREISSSFSAFGLNRPNSPHSPSAISFPSA
jgi:hypothetical protein